MEPGSRVELPPRGADLSFLSNNPETDTPSRWLTFNSTPGGGGGNTAGGGNTTPGTAFGSPFWGSLLASNGLPSSSTNLTPSAIHHAHAHNKLSPKAYSPSKEFNPFELSFFPKHNEHLLSSNKDTKDENSTTKAPLADGQALKDENGDNAADSNQARHQQVKGNDNGLSSSVSSLKRPFQDAQGDEIALLASAPTLQSDASSRSGTQSDDAGLPNPSWKRPKIEDLHAIAPISSDQSTSISAHSSMYAPSPMNMNASPDSGMSPASSAMIPTPSLQHAMLPPNATPGIFGTTTTTTSATGTAKAVVPLEQVEAAKLGNMANGIVNGTAPTTVVPLHPHQQQHLYNVQPQQGGAAITQSVPPPLSANSFHAQHQHHQPGGHPFSYSGYMQQQQQQQPQQQPQPIILPPKTLQQAQQRTASPVTASHPPQSARQGSLEQQQANGGDNASSNNNPIPYANGRGPARPSRATTRSSHGRRGGSNAPVTSGEEQSFVKGEEEDANMYDSSSGNISYQNASSNTKGGSTAKGGKKGKKQGAGGRAGSTGATNSSSNNKNASSSQQATSSANTAPAFVSYNDTFGSGSGGAPNEGGEDDEEGDDEHKRKAFLERNRQAACRSRQKKKEWINNLETHAARLQSENQSLASEIDTLRKELFALRHTLSFHERSGCTAQAGSGGQVAVQHQGANHGGAVPPPPPSATLQQQPQVQVQQQQPRPEWRQQQQQPPQSASLMPQQQQQQQPQYHQPQQQNMTHMSQAPAIVQTHASPQPQSASLQSAHPPPPVHIQTQPQPMTARSSAVGSGGAGPTLAPSALQGMNMQVSQQPTMHDQHQPQHQQLSASQLRAPPKLNLSAASLQPQQQQQQTTGMNGLAPHNHQPPSHGNQHGSANDINRPGSAGATFGLSTPNFADLFNGAMGRMGNGGQTPFLGAGLLFTPGGIMSSGGMLGGGNSSSGNNNGTGYNMSPGLPNTFGLSLQDIPIRPASAPPTPSPALDTRLVAPTQDYFSSKNLTSNLGTSAAFADFLAAYNPANLQTGSVLV